MKTTLPTADALAVVALIASSAGAARDGRVVIIDFIPKAPGKRPRGPPPEQHMSRQEVDTVMAAAGLVPVRVHDFLPEHFFVEYVVK